MLTERKDLFHTEEFEGAKETALDRHRQYIPVLWTQNIYKLGP